MKSYHLRINLFFLLACMAYLPLQAQFFYNGTATGNDSCFQLTQAVNWQVGSVWNGEKVNLDQSFEVSMHLFLGCKDEDGADGVVFGLQPVSTSIGTGGGDLGFADVEPSLGVEFDTHHNPDYDDPLFDHIAVVQDGRVQHNIPQATLAGPVQASATDQNIEDCAFHPVRISWDADMQTLSVYFDCELRLTYSGDIVNDIFDGDPEVFWGFTAATGGLDNLQEVCLSYTSFVDGTEDQTICPGISVQLGASGGSSYLWSPAVGLSDPNIADPIATPDETTLYTVEIMTDCGPVFDEVLITVEDEPFDVAITSFPENPMDIPLGSDLGLIASIDSSATGPYVFTWSSVIGSVFSHPDSTHTVVTSSANQVGTETLIVQVTSGNGCTSADTLSFEIVGTLFDIPNVFTPNRDGVNDTFGPVAPEGVEFSFYRCKIFNRWGELVFESDSFADPWDGRYKGKPATSDVYVYLFQLEIGDVRFEEKGDVTLLR